MKTKIPLGKAIEIANDILARLAPYCERIEIAGSVRRNKPEVGDIEIVAVPKKETDFFGLETSNHLLNTVEWSDFGKLLKNGNKYKQIELHEGVNLDLFIVTFPAQWGVQLLIRTGSAEFSHRFVTAKKYGGLLPSNLRVKDGAIWNGDKLIETPEEADVFKVCEIGFIEPEKRTA